MVTARDIVLKTFGGSSAVEDEPQATSMLVSDSVRQWQPQVSTAIAQYPNVDENFALGVMQAESGGDPEAESPAGAVGLFQFMRDTAKQYGVKNRRKPDEIIPAGVKKLSDLLTRYGGDKKKALAAYNGGESGIDQAVDKYGDSWLDHLHEFKGINPKTGKNHAEETRGYINTIASIVPLKRMNAEDILRSTGLISSEEEQGPPAFDYETAKANLPDQAPELPSYMRSGEPEPKKTAESILAEVGLPTTKPSSEPPYIPEGIKPPSIDRKPTNSEYAQRAGKTFMGSFAELGKFASDVAAGLPEGSALFYNAIGLVPGKIGEWGDRMAQSAHTQAQALKEPAEKAVAYWSEYTPEEQKAFEKGGITASLVVGSAQLAALIPQLVATGGEKQAVSVIEGFAKKYGKNALTRIEPLLTKASERFAGSIVGMGEVGAAHGEATGDAAGMVKGGAEGAAMGTIFPAASTVAGGMVKNAAPIIQNIIKRVAQGVAGGGLSAVEGGTPADIAANTGLGIVMPVGKSRQQVQKSAEGESDASTIRGNEGPVQEGRAFEQGRQDQGGENLQRNQEVGGAEATPQQEGARPNVSVGGKLLPFRQKGPVKSAEFQRLTPEEQAENYRQLEKEAYTDPLMGLMTRRGIDREGIDPETNQTIIADLDKFKDVNDSFGHDIGDKALKTFSAILQKHFGDVAKISRWGGEEIAIFPLQKTPKELIIKRTRAANEELANTDIEIGAGKKVNGLTFSSGLGEGFKAADEQLYSAKERGRSGIQTEGEFYGYEGNRPADGLWVEKRLQFQRGKPGEAETPPVPEQQTVGEPAGTGIRREDPQRTYRPPKISYGDNPEENRLIYLTGIKSELRSEILNQPSGKQQWDYIMGKNTRDNKGQIIRLSEKSKQALENTYDYTKTEEGRQHRLENGIPDDIFADFEDVGRQIQDAPHPFDLKKIIEESRNKRQEGDPWNYPQEGTSEAASTGKYAQRSGIEQTDLFQGTDQADTRTASQKEIAEFLREREANRETKRRENPLEGTMFDQGEMEARATEQTDLFGGKAASVGKFAPRETSEGQRIEGQQKTKGEAPPTKGGETEGAPEPPEGFSVEMPEAVELFNDISGGKFPKIKQKLRAAHGAATGVARGTDIELRADLWKDPEQAIKTMQHEIGHVVDFIPEGTTKRGNILGHLASLKRYMRRYLAGKPGGPEPLDPKEMARLRKIAKQEATDYYAKTIDEEITKETAYTPNEILGIWNKVEAKIDKKLFDYVAELSAEQKKSIIKEAMKGRVAESVPKKIEVTERRSRTEYIKETDPAKVAERYKAIVEREIRKRQLLDAIQVKEELINLSKTWKPFDPTQNTPYTRYRLKNEELYADAFSALAVEPSLVRKTAPNFWSGFHAYMERKPEVKDTWDAIQARYAQGREGVLANRQERIFKGYKKAEEQISSEKQRQEAEKEGKKASVVTSVYRGLVERYGIIESAVAAAKKAGAIIPDEINPFLKAREQRYAGGKQHVYVQESLRAETKAKTDDVNWNNEGVRKYIGAYLQLRRASGELAEKAGSLGIQGKAAEEQLAFMRKQLGEEKAAKIEEAANAYYDVRQNEIVPLLTEGLFADTFSPELVKKIKGNREYARRQIVKDFEDKYGSNAAASLLNIKSVQGTLREQQNPFVATVAYDLGLIRAKTKSDFVRSTVDFFESNQGKESIVGHIKVEPAETENIRGAKRFRHVDTQDMKTVYFLKDGELQARNVSAELADLFENDLGHSDGIMGAMRKIGDVQRSIFVKFSVPFLLRNPFRDIAGSIKNIPQYGVNPLPVLRSTFKAMPEIWKYLRTGEMSPDLKSAFKEGAIPVHRLWESESKVSARDDLDRIVASFEGKPEAHKKWLGRVWGKIDALAEFIGQFEEKGRKLADYKFLKEKTDLTSEARGQMVRASSGTPDVLAGGKAKKITNQLFIFSNANIQGERAAYESFRADPKRYLTKFALYDVLPKAAVMAATAGGATWLAKQFGLGEEQAQWLEDAYNLIPDEDKAKYYTVPLPMRTESGKQFYLRIPSDYAGQTIGAVLYRAIKVGEPQGTQKLVKEAASVSPIGMSQMQPTIELASGWAKYIMNGNTMDSWTGKYVIPEEVQGAGPARELPYMAKWSYDQVGGSIVWRIPDNFDLREKGAFEKAIGIPLLGPALSAFIKVSDRGAKEKIQNIALEARKEQKNISLTVKDKIIDSLKDRNPDKEKARSLYKEAKDVGYQGTFGEFYSRYQVLALKRLGDQDVKQIMQAQSKREKEAVIDAILEKKNMTEKEKKAKKRNMLRNARLFDELTGNIKEPDNKPTFVF